MALKCKGSYFCLELGVNRKSKVKEGVDSLKKHDGSMALTNTDKAQVLNTFFASVFTNEITNDMPSCSNSSPWPVIDSVELSYDDVLKRLIKET